MRLNLISPIPKPQKIKCSDKTERNARKGVIFLFAARGLGGSWSGNSLCYAPVIYG